MRRERGKEGHTSSSAFLLISSFHIYQTSDGRSPYEEEDLHNKSRSSFHPSLTRVMFCDPFEVFMSLAQVDVVEHLLSAVAPCHGNLWLPSLHSAPWPRPGGKCSSSFKRPLPSCSTSIPTLRRDKKDRRKKSSLRLRLRDDRHDLQAA